METQDKIRQRYHRAREKLIAELGAKCTQCGSKDDLQFHHTEPRTWIARKKARWVRLAIYRREAQQGLVELLCKKCNILKGEPQTQELSEPWF